MNADGVYRRIRNETPLTLDEAFKISEEFNLNFSLLRNTNGEQKESPFLETVRKYFLHYKQRGKYTLHFDAKELPVFYLLHKPELYWFKQSFWGQIFFDQKPNLEELKKVHPTELIEEVLELYETTDSIDLWEGSIITTTLRQIDYACEIGMITKDKSLSLLDDLSSLLMLLEDYCINGKKMAGGKLEVYLNNVLIGDNTSIVTSDNNITCFLSKNIVDVYPITDNDFNEKRLKIFNNTIQRSTRISVSSERERKKYFKGLHQEVKVQMESLGK